MPRSLRPELAGGIHHVYARGACRQPIFLDDLDRRRYLATVARVVQRMSWRCLSYCLMGNHMHLLIETPQPNLGRGMQRLHGTYAQGFNGATRNPATCSAPATGPRASSTTSSCGSPSDTSPAIRSRPASVSAPRNG